MTANFTPAADLLPGWRGDVLSGKPPTLYPVGTGALGRIEIGPGTVTLIGGPPGAGKTAFVMQLVADALRLTPTLKALVANVEMSPTALLDRQLARLSGIDLTTIRHRKLIPAHAERIDFGMAALAGIVGRLAFLRPPHAVENVARSADAFGADLIVLDYIQRIAPPGERGDRKTAVDALMEFVRGFAEAGVAVVVVAAVGRQKDAKGRSGYDGLNLASFRESSELEYGADDAYLLARGLRGRGGGDAAARQEPARRADGHPPSLRGGRAALRPGPRPAGRGQAGRRDPRRVAGARRGRGRRG